MNVVGDDGTVMSCVVICQMGSFRRLKDIGVGTCVSLIPFGGNEIEISGYLGSVGVEFLEMGFQMWVYGTVIDFMSRAPGGSGEW